MRFLWFVKTTHALKFVRINTKYTSYSLVVNLIDSFTFTLYFIYINIVFLFFFHFDFILICNSNKTFSDGTILDLWIMSEMLNSRFFFFFFFYESLFISMEITQIARMVFGILSYCINNKLYCIAEYCPSIWIIVFARKKLIDWMETYLIQIFAVCICSKKIFSIKSWLARYLTKINCLEKTKKF